MKRKMYAVYVVLCVFLGGISLFGCNQKSSTICIGWSISAENASASWQETLSQKEEKDNAYLQEQGKSYRLEYRMIVLDETADLKEQLKGIDLLYGSDCNFTIEQLHEHFLDLSKELTDGMLRSLYDRMPEMHWETLQLEGAIFNTVRFTPPPTQGLWIDRSVLKELKLEVPEELIGQPLDKWKDFFAAIYEANGHKPFIDRPEITTSNASPVLVGNTWEAHFQMIAPHLGIAYDEPELGVQCVYESEYAKKMNQIWKEYFEAGYIGNRWDPADKETLFVRTHVSYALRPHDIQEVYWVYPLQEYGYSTNAWTDRRNPYNLELEVTKAAADKDSVYEFLCNLAEDQEFAQTICAQEVGYKFFTPMTQIMNPIGGASTLLNGFTEPQQENRSLIIEQYEKMKHCPAPGFVFMRTEAIEEELQKIDRLIYAESDAGTVRYNVIGQMVSGSMDWADYEKALDTFVQRLYEEGLEEVIEEANRQLKEYMGT